MIPELRFDRTVDLVKLAGKNHFIEFRDHLTPGKFSQLPAPLAGGALRMLLGHIRKIASALDFLFKF